MGLPKIIGDTLGVAAFALAMGAGRVAYGTLKKRGTAWLPSQSRLMLMGSGLAAVSYVVMAATYNPVFALLACAMCGLGVSLLWPGTLSLSVKAFPLAGTWMFAVMAAGGNIGASLGPAALGIIADHGDLRLGYLWTAVIPVVSLVCLVLYRYFRKTDTASQV
jgi:MFS family permease